MGSAGHVKSAAMKQRGDFFIVEIFAVFSGSQLQFHESPVAVPTDRLEVLHLEGTLVRAVFAVMHSGGCPREDFVHDRFAQLVLRDLQLVGSLQVHPELRCGTEVS